MLTAEEVGAQQQFEPGPKWALTVERPFPGLRPFAFPDHPFFFGREDQTYAVYRLLDRSRFIAVVGASGGGKSSLVRAGLLPLLEKETEERGGRKWDWYELRPGDSPIDSLAVALSGQPEAEQDEFARAVFEAKRERLLYALRRSSFGLVDALNQLQLPKGQSVVLVIDQFEELFRFSAADKTTGRNPLDEMRRRDESAHFVQLLLEASRDSKVAVHVLITMRSDFIGDCARYHGLPEAVSASQFLVPALTRDQREDIIQCPIERANATIDPELVERLINDSNDEFDLPVLQHCLMRLWEEAGKRDPEPTNVAPADDEGNGSKLDRPHSRHLKLGLYTTVGGIARALSAHAEEILAGLAGDGIAVEQTFRALSEVDKNGRATRRALILERLSNETGVPEDQLRRVIDRFRADDCSFLVPPSSSVPVLKPSTRIDVGHEALLRSWERISSEPKPGLESKRQMPREGWLWQEDFDGRAYQALLALIESAGPRTRVTLPLDSVNSRWKWWTSRHRTAAWAERYGGGFDRVQLLFEDSRNALKADRIRQQVAEANERDRVTQAARVERETLERQKAEAEAKLLRTNARSTRIIAVLLAGLVIVALAALYFSQTQRNRAVRQSDVAEAERNEANKQRAAAETARIDAEIARIDADKQRADAEIARNEADKLRADAETDRTKAVKQRADALALQSRIFASQSRREAARGYTRFGLLLAQEAFKPLEQSGLPSFRWPMDAEMALHMAIAAVTPSQLLAKIAQQADRTVLGPDAKLIATVSLDNVVRIWNREGKSVGEIRHKQRVRSVTFSQDGTQLVTASWDQTATVWKAADGTATTLQHDADVNFAAFSPDGQHIVTASDKDGHIWSISGTKLATLRAAYMSHAAFAPDGKRVVTSDGSVGAVWTLQGKQLFKLPTNDLLRASFSPDGKSILTISGDKTPRIWSSDGKQPRPLVGHQDAVTDATFNLDGSRLITVSRDQTAQIWDLNKLEVVATLRHEGSVLSARFSSDGNQILTTGGDGTVRLWSSNGSKLGSLQLQTNASAASFDLDGPGIFTVAGNELRYWDPSKRGVSSLVHPNVVNLAAFDRSGKRVLTLAVDRIARVWTPATNKFVKIGGPGVARASFVGDGSRVLVWSRDRGVQLWSVEGTRLQDFPNFEGSSSEFYQRLLGKEGRGMELLPSHDGEYFLATNRELESIILWDAKGKKLAQFRGTSARFNRDSTLIATESRDGAAFLWNIAGNEIAQLSQSGGRRDGNKASILESESGDLTSVKGAPPKLKTVEFSADGKRVLVGYSEGQVQIWAEDGAKIAEFQTGGNISSAFFNTDGTQVAIVRPREGVEFWSASGQRIAVVDQRSDLKSIQQFSPNGSTFLATSRDKATLWDTGGKVIGDLRHDAPLLGATFSVDGGRILTHSSDGSIRVWSAAGAKLAEITLEGRISSVSFNADATQILVAGVDAVARIFTLRSPDETRRLAEDLKLEPLTSSERLRLLVFDTSAEVEPTYRDNR
jgi:WD40 repeat protein